MTTTALDRAHSKAQRLERELREAQAALAKARRAALNEYAEAAEQCEGRHPGTWADVAADVREFAVSTWPTITALDQDGDDA